MISEELKTVMDLLKKAGEEISLIYNSPTEVKKKKDDSPVTSADNISEKILISGLKKFGYNILSEESSNKFLETEKTWIIDPLDGTKDFIEKTGEFAIMIGLIEKGEPVLGLVYQPIEKKIYWAEKGKGAYIQKKGGSPQRLRVFSQNNLSKAKFVVSRHHLSKKELNFIKQCSNEKIKYMGSLGLKLGQIAEGKADAYINLSSKTYQWDSCAPEMIITEAEGIITDREGKKLNYRTDKIRNIKGLVASNRIIHKKIINLLSNYD